MKNEFMVCTTGSKRCIVSTSVVFPFKDVEYIGTLKEIRKHFLPDSTLGSIKKELYTKGFYKL